MQKVATLNVFDSFECLDCKHDSGVQAELLLAVGEKALQTWSSELDHHYVVVTLYECTLELWDAFTLQQFQKLCFV